MKLTKITVGGREFSLAFTLNAMCTLQDSIEDFRLEKIADYVKTPKGLLEMLYALAEQGELLEGRTMDASRQWLGSHISPAPSAVLSIQVAILDALNKGLNMETEDGAGEEEDAVLAELKKNGTTAG